MGGADLVADRAEPSQVGRRFMQFLSRFGVDGVDDQMRMDMRPVDVRCDQNLVALPRACGKLPRDLICHKRRDLFIRIEGLDVMAEAQPVRFVPIFLGRHELLVRKQGNAVLTGRGKHFLTEFRFGRLHAISHDLFHHRWTKIRLVPIRNQFQNRHGLLLSLRQNPEKYLVNLPEFLCERFQTGRFDASHIGESGELVEIVSDPVQLGQDRFEVFDQRN